MSRAGRSGSMMPGGAEPLAIVFEEVLWCTGAGWSGGTVLSRAWSGSRGRASRSSCIAPGGVELFVIAPESVLCCAGPEWSDWRLLSRVGNIGGVSWLVGRSLMGRRMLGG
jgi:hypothetical protein